MLKAYILNILFISSVLGCSSTSKTPHIWPNDNQVVVFDSIKNIPTENIVAPKPMEKKEMHVALMLPFFTNEIEFNSLGIEIISITDKSNLAIQYLHGVQIALDSLDHAGVKLELNIFDDQKDTDRIISFMNSQSVKNADAIIGPVSNSGLIVAGRSIDQKHQILFSPLSASQNLSIENANFVLANAGLKTHCEQLATFINTKYPNKKILLLYRRDEGESEYAAYFKSILKTKPIELTEKSDSSFYQVDDLLTAIDNNIIIIPSFDQEFVNLLSKKLFELTANYKLILFGMPTWTEMETLRLDYLQKLNTHITSSFYSDDSLKNFIQFRNKFKNKYSSLPNEFSYQGYSLVLSIGNLWKLYGDKWFEHLQQPITALGVDYNFQPVILNEHSSTDFIENKHVYILSFQNNKLLREK
ncbi:hypothetical protein LBMAG27_04400 [Bacteroidota bacterium]|nr:hypothetical protein LBMAG27_04400 [Bacteroidota bacterium]